MGFVKPWDIVDMPEKQSKPWDIVGVPPIMIEVAVRKAEHLVIGSN